MTILLVALVAMLFGIWTLRDSRQLSVRITKAEQLMKSGMSEGDAMEKSGSNWWDNPWYMRMVSKPPSIESD